MKFKVLRKCLAKSFPFFLRKYIPRQILKHLYFSGVFEARLNGAKVTKLVHVGHQIENEIYWKGFEDSHEGQSLQLWTHLIKVYKPNVIWNIGANSGTYGLLAKAISPQSEIYFFEPIPSAVQLIHENLKVNRYEGKVFDFALGDYDGKGEIYLPSGNNFPTSVTVNKNTTKEGGGFDVIDIDVHRIDSLLAEEKLQLPQLVKIDVETYEPEVLSGFGSAFPKDCIFLIEILENEIALRLQEIFSPLNYVFYNINDRKKTFRQTEILSKSDFYNYLIIPRNIHQEFSKERVSR
jgi:FkbM family methyltransferase